MTNGQIRTACDKYWRVLVGLGAPVRLPNAKTRTEWISHIGWMCEEIPKFLVESQPFETETSRSKVEKAMRWLGFVQGQLAAHGIMTVDEMKEDNR